MAFPIPIIDGIIKLFDKGIDKIIPDASEKMRIKGEFRKFAIELPFKQWKLFEDRVRAEMTNPVWYRDIVRPIISLSSWGAYLTIKGIVLYFLVKFYIPILTAIDATAENLPILTKALGEFAEKAFTWYDVVILSTILGFWFGPKAFERIMEKVGNMKSIKSMFLGGGNA